MNAQDCLNFLSQYHAKESPHEGGRHLQVMDELLKLFKIDVRRFDIVQITGSCGKGSTATFVSSMLQAANMPHGLFTGPHLIRYEERFSIDGKPIASGEFIDIVSEIAEKTADYDMSDAGHKHLMTLIAMMWFARKKVPLVIFENGAGGWSDPSNIFDPVIACLTEITLEHTQLLGETVTAITKDKAAIIKDSAMLAVCGMNNAEARRYLMDLEAIAHTRFSFIHRDYDIRADGGGLVYQSHQEKISGIELGLPGTHQQQNAANALMVIEGLKEIGYRIETGAIIAGLRQARFPGRLECIQWESKELILDGAHNPLELRVLSQNLNRLGVAPKVILISFASKKNVAEMLKALGLSQALYIVAPSPFAARQQSQAAVEAVFTELNLEFKYYADVEAAWQAALCAADDKLLVTGSLYLVGKVRELLLASGL